MKTMSQTFTAEITREGKWWMVRIPEINGLTQARRLDEAELMAREFIAVTQELELEDVAVTVCVRDVAGIDVADALTRIAEERLAAEIAERAASEHTIELARSLAAQNVPLRDIGAVLGVSFQRAHQLVKS